MKWFVVITPQTRCGTNNAKKSVTEKNNSVKKCNYTSYIVCSECTLLALFERLENLLLCEFI